MTMSHHAATDCRGLAVCVKGTIVNPLGADILGVCVVALQSRDCNVIGGRSGIRRKRRPNEDDGQCHQDCQCKSPCLIRPLHRYSAPLDHEINNAFDI
ncbi:hypothetical protein RHIZ404_170039 [Rhizobium sp. EC-SD404]|nr:hypothetical protein RHIZ404_170039 [Rhizobium sp. EC-SD404]